MRTAKLAILVLVSIIPLLLSGCGSSRDSGGSTTSQGTTLADASTLGISNCLTCHAATSTLVQGWMKSRHGNRMTAAIKIAQDSLEVPAEDISPDHCGYCHPEDDTKLLDYVYLETVEPTGTDWSQPTEPDSPVIGCEYCHGGGQFHNGIAAGIPFPTPGPAQCGQCHYLNDAIDNDEWAADGEYPHHTTSRGTPTLARAGGSVRRNVTDTHVDDPATTTVIEGYAIRYSQQNGCVDCHFLGHEMNLSINYDWASSAHAGTLKVIKDTELVSQVGTTEPPPGDDVILTAVTAVGADGDDHAWPHYDWDAENRQSCQRCHTATGAMNFMTDPTTYDPSNNDFSHLSGWSKAADGTITSSGQNELLNCWGCHSDSSGTLRTPGAITEEYDATVTVAYPDIDGSNVCMTCHLGRETGAVVNAKDGFDNERFVNSHYLAAGGSVFGQTGYAFATRDYTPTTDVDVHVNLGRGTTEIDAIDDNYTNGPCVTCHFSSTDGSHTLSPFTTYTPVTDVALNPVCVECHTTRGSGSNAAEAWFGKDFVLADLAVGVVAPHKGRYLAALEALNQELIDDGFTFTAGYPYFSNTNWLSDGTGDIPVDTDTTGNVTGKNNMGAAFNYNLLIHEPGGVAHNRLYTRRLLYDSIDWMDNGVLDYSVAATLNTEHAGTAYLASAKSYLLQAELGTAGDRY